MTEVPVYKQLDRMIRGSARPSDVVGWLSSRSREEMTSVSKDSLEFSWCYQLDFLCGCSKDETETVISLLDEFGTGYDKLQLKWQVWSSNCNECAFLKYDYSRVFRKWTSDIMPFTPHPYHGISGPRADCVRRHDETCVRICREPRGRAFGAAWSSEFMADPTFMYDRLEICHSLFERRVLSSDVYLCLDPVGRYGFVAGMTGPYLLRHNVVRLALSLIDDERVPAAEKSHVIDRVYFRDAGTMPLVSNDKRIGQVSSGDELAIKAVVSDYRFEKADLLDILYDKPDWILALYDACPDEIDSVLSCRDVAEFRLKRRKRS